MYPWINQWASFENSSSSIVPQYHHLKLLSSGSRVRDATELQSCSGTSCQSWILRSILPLLTISELFLLLYVVRLTFFLMLTLRLTVRRRMVQMISLLWFYFKNLRFWVYGLHWQTVSPLNILFDLSFLLKTRVKIQPENEKGITLSPQTIICSFNVFFFQSFRIYS